MVFRPQANLYYGPLVPKHSPKSLFCCWQFGSQILYRKCGIKDVVIKVMDEPQVYPQPLLEESELTSAYFECSRDLSKLTLWVSLWLVEMRIFGKIAAYIYSLKSWGIYNTTINSNDVRLSITCPHIPWPVRINGQLKAFLCW